VHDGNAERGDFPGGRSPHTEGSTVSYAEDVGARLRRIRLQQGLSLQDVERRSDGQWKAAVIGSYERGDRNISASRLCELAEFYQVSPSDVLPQDDAPRPVDRSRSIVIDLSRIEADPDRWGNLRRFCESIQVQRGDYNRSLLSIRGEDVRSLAIILDTTPEGLLDTLRDEGLLADV